MTETTTFDLTEYDVKPLEVDYQITANNDVDDIPLDSYPCRMVDYHITPDVVQVVEDIMDHIVKRETGQYMDILDIVVRRWEWLGIKQETRDLFND